MPATTRFRLVLRIAAVLVAIVAWVGALRAADSIQWKNIGPGGGGNIHSVAISPADPNIVLGSSDVGGFVWSNDGGANWHYANQAMISSNQDWTYGAYEADMFVFSPFNANTVFAGGERSTDAGRTWSSAIGAARLPGGQGGVADPNNANIVYIFGYDMVYRSDDAWTTSGYHASQLPQGPPSGPSGLIHSLVLDPTTSGDSTSAHLIACADNGLYESCDSGANWHAMPLNGLPHAHCNRIRLRYAAGNPASKTLYVALQTQPFAGIALDAGRTWDTIDSAGGVNAWAGGVYRSDNWGSTWTCINGPDRCGAGSTQHEPELLPNPAFYEGTSEDNATSWTFTVNNGGTVKRKSESAGEYHIELTYNDTPANSNVSITTGPVLLEGGQHYVIAASFKTGPDCMNDTATGVIADADIFYFSDAQATQQLNWPGMQRSYTTPIGMNVGQTETKNCYRRYEAMFQPPTSGSVYAKVVFQAGYGHGQIWLDDVSLKKLTGLPQIVGSGGSPSFISYSDIALDAYDSNTTYVATQRQTSLEPIFLADNGGVWKFDSQTEHWSHLTRQNWHANVWGGSLRSPVCGDQVCGGGWETWETCPADCALAWRGYPNAHCGDQVCNSTYESAANCRADCPFDPDPNPMPGRDVMWEADPNISYSWVLPAPGLLGLLDAGSLAIGQDPQGVGNKTLHFGGEHMRTTDGGVTWADVSSSPATGQGWVSNGDTNDVYTYTVVNDTRDSPPRNWVLYGDDDNRMMISYDGGVHYVREGWQWASLKYPSPAPSDPDYAELQYPVVYGGAVTSIVLDKRSGKEKFVYVAVTHAGAKLFDPNTYLRSGIVKGEYHDPVGNAVGYWTWSLVGTKPFKSNAPIDLLMTGSGTLIASVYGRGIYRLNGPDDTGIWEHVDDVNWGNPSPACGAGPTPTCWKTYRLAYNQATGRIFVAVGQHMDFDYPFAAGEAGVWESSNDGVSWRRITGTPGGASGSPLEQDHPVTGVVVVDSSTLLVGTTRVWNIPGADGGLYRGTYDPGQDRWNWSLKLSQPIVTGIVGHPGAAGVYYAFAGQGCCGNVPTGQDAGIYKSTDYGMTWGKVPVNDGLMNLGHGRLFFGETNPRKIYAATIGSGVFEGTITCGSPAEGFTDTDSDGTADCTDTDDDNDGVLDTWDNCPLAANAGQQNLDGDALGDVCDPDADGDGYSVPGDCVDTNAAIRPNATETCNGIDDNCSNGVDEGGVCNVNVTGQATPSPGSVSPNDVSKIAWNSSDNQYEVFVEMKPQGSNKYQLSEIWTITGIQVGKTYDLQVEAKRSAGEIFDVYAAVSSTGSCSVGSFSGSALLSVGVTETTQSVSLGAATQSTICVRLKDRDPSGGDNTQDNVSLDRIFLVKHP